MIRPFILACAALALALPSLPAAAQAPRTAAIQCRLLLPEAPIPGNPGHWIVMLELTVAAGHDSHRHQHNSVEYLHVISGNGTLKTEGMADAALDPGTVHVILKKTPHQVHNHSATAALVFATTFIEDEADHTVTVKADTQHFCPQRRPRK
jgi:quercetin dioxygenase-like cupin family protein